MECCDHPGCAAAADTAAPASDGPWVERRRGLGVEEFRAHYLLPRRPVVLADVLDDWPALGTFSHEFFRRRFADLPVQVRGRGLRLGDVIDRQLASTSEWPGPYPCTLAKCDALLPYLTPRFACSLPSRHAHPRIPRRVFELVNHLEVFFGGPGGMFPRVHWDIFHMHAWVAQVHGEKEFTLFEPGQEELLYVNPDLPWLSFVQDPCDYARFPLLRGARAHRVRLRAGDALFLPCGTWHTARCLGLNITVAFDQLEASNWRAFAADVVAAERRRGRGLRALALGARLRVLGAWFDAIERAGGANRNAHWGAGRVARSARPAVGARLRGAQP